MGPVVPVWAGEPGVRSAVHGGARGYGRERGAGVTGALGAGHSGLWHTR
jgi:hypothetical protein